MVVFHNSTRHVFLYFKISFVENVLPISGTPGSEEQAITQDQDSKVTLIMYSLSQKKDFDHDCLSIIVTVSNCLIRKKGLKNVVL